jgi:hypothetical protein
VVPELHGPAAVAADRASAADSAHTPSISQGGWPACTKAHQPFAGGAFADSVLASKLSKAPTFIEVLPDQAFPTDRWQAGIQVCMHGL